MDYLDAAEGIRRGFNVKTTPVFARRMRVHIEARADLEDHALYGDSMVSLQPLNDAETRVLWSRTAQTPTRFRSPRCPSRFRRLFRWLLKGVRFGKHH
jgi:hypothetical protein